MNDTGTSQTVKPEWSQLLQEAVARPGLILDAYSAFHTYSLGNQIAAMWQCAARGIQPGPIDTFKGWLDKGRTVRKGEKAITLCMPVGCRLQQIETVDPDTGETVTETVAAGRRRGFTWRPFWFILSQTDGDPAAPAVEVPVRRWDKRAALRELEISQVPFTHPDGNAQGFARNREIAVSPVAALPHKTLFHELAHVVLGHTVKESLSDGAELPRSLREVEAEGVAYLICATLELPGTEYSRGYIQHWLRGEVIPETSARRIFGAADKILKAGNAPA